MNTQPRSAAQPSGTCDCYMRARHTVSTTRILESRLFPNARVIREGRRPQCNTLGRLVFSSWTRPALARTWNIHARPTRAESGTWLTNAIVCSSVRTLCWDHVCEYEAIFSGARSGVHQIRAKMVLAIARDWNLDSVASLGAQYKSRPT